MSSKFYPEELAEVRHRRRVTQSWNQAYTRTLGMRMKNLDQQERSSLGELRRQRGVFMSQYSHHLHNIRPRDLIELTDPYLRMRIQPGFSRGENLCNNIRDVKAGKLHPPGYVFPSKEPPSLTVGHRDIGNHYKTLSKLNIGGTYTSAAKEWQPIKTNDSNMAADVPKITVSSRWKRSTNKIKSYSALTSGSNTNDDKPLLVIGGSNYSSVVRTPIAMTQKAHGEQFRNQRGLGSDSKGGKAIGTIWEEGGREGKG